jgi:hypothetical protein
VKVTGIFSKPLTKLAGRNGSGLSVNAALISPDSLERNPVHCELSPPEVDAKMRVRASLSGLS